VAPVFRCSCVSLHLHHLVTGRVGKLDPMGHGLAHGQGWKKSYGSAQAKDEESQTVVDTLKLRQNTYFTPLQTIYSSHH
jgi:hypothetical protein